jgi:hypothetical protein
MGNVRAKDYTAPSLKRSEMPNISVQPKTYNVQSWEARRSFVSHSNSQAFAFYFWHKNVYLAADGKEQE